MFTKRLLITTIFIATSLFTIAQTITWDGGGDGVNWSDPLNWDNDNLPNATNDVLIDITFVTLSINATIRSLTLTGGNTNGTTQLAITNATLNIDGDPLSTNSGVELVGYETALFIDELSTVNITNPGIKGVDIQPETRVIVEGNLFIDQVANDNGISISGDYTFLIVDGNLTITNVTNGNYIIHENEALIMGGGTINVPDLTIGTLGEISAGSFGDLTDSLTINGHLNFAANSEYTLNLNGAGDVPGLNNDLINVNGNLHLEGRLKVKNLSPLNDGNDYLIMTYSGSLSGVFESLILPQGTTGFALDYSTPGEIHLVDICIGLVMENIWNADGDGVSWEDPDNWSLNHVPTICEPVIINNNADNSVPVQLNSIIQIQFLYLKRGTLIINPNAELNVDYNAFTIGGDGFSNGEPITLLNDAHIVNNGSISIINAYNRGFEVGTDYFGSSPFFPSSFINNGNLHVEYSGTFGLSCSNTGSIENNGDITIQASSLDNVNTGITIKPDFRNSFLNNGDITISNIQGSNARGINVAEFGFTNGPAGSISITALDPTTYGIFNLALIINEGSIDIQASNANNSISNRSTFSNLSTGVISVDQEFINSDSLRNDGQIILSNGAEFRNEFAQGAGVYFGNGDFDGIFKNASSTGFGEILPGNSIGQLSFNGSLICNTSSQLRSKINIELGGNDGGGALNGHDSIHVNGDLNLGGLLRVSPINGFLPNTLDTFTIITYSGNLNGTFFEIEFDGGINFLDVDYSIPGKILLYSTCQSANNNWTGGGTNNYWNNATNWSLGIPSPCHDVVISNANVLLLNNESFDIEVASITLINGANLNVGSNNSVNIIGTASNQSYGLFLDQSIFTSSSDLNISYVKINGIYNETGEINTSRFVRINNFNTDTNFFGAGITNSEAAVFNHLSFSIEIDLENSNDKTSGILNITDGVINSTGAINLFNLHSENAYGVVNDEGIFNSRFLRFFNTQGRMGIWNRFGDFNTNISTEDFSNKVNFQNDHTLNAANLIKVDSFFNNGTIKPGNTASSTTIGLLDFESNTILSPSSIIEMEIKGNMGPGMVDGNDWISCTESLILDGELEIQLDPSYTPNVLDTFVLIEYSGQLTGTFNTVTIPSLLSAFTIDYGFAVPGKVILIYDCSGINTFVGSVNQSWEEAGNWSKNQVPLKCETVFISGQSVYLNSEQKAYSLLLVNSSSLNILSDGNLTVNPDSLATGLSVVYIDKSTLVNKGILNIHGFDNPTLQIGNFANATNSGTINLHQIGNHSGIHLSSNSNFVNYGNLFSHLKTIHSARDLFVGFNCTFDNTGNLELRRN